MMKRGFAALSLFLKNINDRIPYFEIHYSLFDIRYSFFQSFLSIKLTAFRAGRLAQP